MIILSPDGRYVLTANEGEPNTTYTVDPEGSVSIIDLHRGVRRAEATTLRFTEYNGQENMLRGLGIRIYGPSASAAQDLEPEYVAVSEDSRTAWVTLQENNAIAVIDIKHARVKDLLPLGYKNHNAPGNGLDPSDRDTTVRIAQYPILGMYQPDAVVPLRSRGRTYLLTANEGDAREYEAFSELRRVRDLTLDPTVFPNGSFLRNNNILGRLRVTGSLGNPDGDNDYDALYAFGARSFSVWSDEGELVFDSGDDLEQITASEFPTGFNSTNDDNNSFDTRSDDKVPEPEGLVLGKVLTRTYAFLGLERIGGVAVFDVSNPGSPKFVQYVNTRDFSGSPAAGTAGDLGPEGLTFIPRLHSPIFKPLLVVGNEISGTVAIYEVNIVGSGNSPEFIVEGEGEPAAVSAHATLNESYPNPFNPTTTISFTLETESRVTLIVYDVLGREVARLADGPLPAGLHSAVFEATNLASGLYLCRLDANGHTSMRRMMLMK